MTKTLYYTDPLKAAWMLREFDVQIYIMRLTHSPYKKKKALVNQSLRSICNHIVKGSHHAKYYIHPDSMHIFEPQNEDEGITEGHIAIFFDNGVWCKCSQPDYQFSKSTKVFIEKRKDKVFFTPEVEDE